MIAGLVACIVALALYPGLILHRADHSTAGHPSLPPSRLADAGGRAMNFNAPHVDYAGLSPVIALTRGIVVVLMAGLLPRSAGSTAGLTIAGARRHRRPLDLAVGTRTRTWSPGRCGSTPSAWRRY